MARWCARNCASEDIEDLQVEYCVDDGASSPNCSSDSAWTDSIDSSNADNVWMVRISLLARSSRKDPQNLRSNTRPALANHAASTTADSFYREVLLTEVTVRNLRYQARL